MLATGGTIPLPPHGGRLDATPLVTVLAALLVVRFVLGVGLTWHVATGAAVLGTALGFAIEAWGIATPTAVAFLAATAVTAPLRRRARGGPSSA
jgi:uncharacterized membrane protein YdjX (TVP38/TMEM64 family)